ncbi:MAG: bifunctional 4-hydroxy-2-oxoglutarate aldolase/2-dehydro-3-deoxy-phosphogluconate aldolase [Rhodospirillaceae bacterium]
MTQPDLNATDRHARMAAICALAPVVPVLLVDRVEDAVPLAKALTAGGLPVLEVTLRTEAALDVIRAMREGCPDAVVGVGTLRTKADVSAALEAGAQFGVSPGVLPEILDAAEEKNFALLPGTATPSEMMFAAGEGYRILKLFPAEMVGGLPLIKAVSSPLADLKFCPTGGIDAKRAVDYLAQPNVVCVGGSWVAPRAMVDGGDWAGIQALAAEAAALAR